jgi:hypothetical protein
VEELFMNRTKLSFPFHYLKVIGILLFILPAPATACQRVRPFSYDELFVADTIVRATAIRYIVMPDPSTRRTTDVPDSTVEFRVEEVLNGKGAPDTLVLNGYLSDRDDYNDVEVPYKVVRSNGRRGSCFANTYREGAQFLLFLKKTKDGYTPNISSLGPTNEQLHGIGDDWLRWVRGYLKSEKIEKSRVTFYIEIEIMNRAMPWSFLQSRTAN